MNLKRTLSLLSLVCVFALQSTFAQQFVPAFTGFSKKKVAYIHMEDGTIAEGLIKDFDWKKGLIEEIKLETDKNAKKQKITPDQIKVMYLPPSGFAKYVQAVAFLNDASKWDNTDLDADIIGKGYAFMEKSDVTIKKKTRTLMLQLINPNACSKIRVYHDPMAGETASVGVGPVKAGGDAKSYFVKKNGDKAAYKVEKKDYKETFKTLFGDCPSMMKKYGAKPKWGDFAQHVYEYGQCK